MPYLLGMHFAILLRKLKAKKWTPIIGQCPKLLQVPDGLGSRVPLISRRGRGLLSLC